MKYRTIDEFIEVQRNLLKLEQDEEVLEKKTLRENQSLKELEKRGVCVRNLFVEHRKTGLYGRFLVTFAISLKMKAAAENEKTITAHKMSPGIYICFKTSVIYIYIVYVIYMFTCCIYFF